MRSVSGFVKYFCTCYRQFRLPHASSFAPVYAPAGTGLADLDLAQERQSWLQLFPYPASEIFARRVVQSRNVVQVVVIELFEDGFETGFEFGKVHHPSGRFRSIAFCTQSYMERVSVQARTLVSLRDIGQAMGCFKVKLFVYFHVLALCGQGCFGDAGRCGLK